MAGFEGIIFEVRGQDQEVHLLYAVLGECQDGREGAHKRLPSSIDMDMNIEI
jgi:hypothetical protein